MRSQAMLAGTIAEFHLEEEALAVDLEIGVEDLEAFRNLLPNEIYEKLGNPPLPFAQRSGLFFTQDFPISIDGDTPLVGRITKMEPRPRIIRDNITGEPLSSGEDSETILFVRIEYSFEGHPEAITFSNIRSPRPASVGFVVYHLGVPVNDFRYLSPGQRLNLDWEDPWYSQFETRSLRRQYFAPMSGFIYVEPYEVRKEIVARPKDLEHWIDLGLAGRETIPVEMQPEMLRRIGDFLREHQPVVIDGRVIEPELARVNFLERTLRSSRVIDPPEEIGVYSAMIGAIFVYPIEKPLPQTVTMEWDLWNEQTQQVPASAVDQAGPLPTILDPEWRVLEWENFLKNPALPTLSIIEAPPGAGLRSLRVVRWILLFAAIALAFSWFSRRSGTGGRRGETRPVLLGALVLATLSTGGAFALSRGAALDAERTYDIVSALLHNVYRAFDFRKEEQIYDVLARSVEGELLEQIYLETRRSLELASQGGARAKVKEVDLVELETQRGDAGAFEANAVWNVMGSIGHWGHVHQRRNRYRAKLEVAPVDGAWKLVGLEILEEERIQKQP